MYTYTAYEQAVTGMIAPNPYLYNYFLWECNFFLFMLFLFMPIFSRT